MFITIPHILYKWHLPNFANIPEVSTNLKRESDSCPLFQEVKGGILGSADHTHWENPNSLNE